MNPHCNNIFRAMLSVITIVVGKEIGRPNSNPRRDCVSLHAKALCKDIQLFIPLEVINKANNRHDFQMNQSIIDNS